MYDLFIDKDNKDISIIKTTNSLANEELFDIELITDVPLEDSLLRRAIETPYEYISSWVYQEDGIDIIDYDFGNELYFILAEPLTISWINLASSYVKRALSFVLDIVDVSNINFNYKSTDTLNIDIIYNSAKSNKDSLSVDISL